MELFHEDGHLTNTGLEAVIDGRLNELESLEASEHLGFCSLCMERYLTLLETAPLMQPETPLKEPVMRRIGRKARRILFSRYATVAAAACLALVMWGSNFTSSFIGKLQDNPEKPGISATQPSAPVREEFQPSLATRMSRAMMELPQNLFGFFTREEENKAAAKPDASKDQPSATSQPNANSASSQSVAP